jgi:hypothetical protein
MYTPPTTPPPMLDNPPVTAYFPVLLSEYCPPIPTPPSPQQEKKRRKKEAQGKRKRNWPVVEKPTNITRISRHQAEQHMGQIKQYLMFEIPLKFPLNINIFPEWCFFDLHQATSAGGYPKTEINEHGTWAPNHMFLVDTTLPSL